MFSLKRTNSQKTFLILKFVIDTISNWTSYGTIQGVIVLVISNRPRASRSSDFEITHAISSWIVLHSVQLLLLIARVFSKSDERAKREVDLKLWARLLPVQPRPRGSLLSCTGNRDPWPGPTTFRFWMAFYKIFKTVRAFSLVDRCV